MVARRSQEIARLQRLLERMHSPRLHMMLIVALTGAVGFLASVALLRAGVDSLWLRYPMAVAIAYLAFLALLWCWLRLRRDDVLDGLDILSSGWDWGSLSWVPRCEPGGGRFGGGGASGSFDDRPRPAQLAFEGASASGSGSGSGEPWGVFDLADLAFVLVVVAALAGAAWAALWMIWAAPALLAELMLDAALATGLYRRLRGIEGDHWLRTAIRRAASKRSVR